MGAVYQAVPVKGGRECERARPRNYGSIQVKEGSGGRTRASARVVMARSTGDQLEIQSSFILTDW
jgi:hypothetical protein